MGFSCIDARMEPLVAPPDRCDARLAVARARSEAPELGQAPDHLAERGRSLWRVAVLRQRIHGVPRPGCKRHVARHLGRGATSHGATGDPPGHQAKARQSVQPPLIRLHASRLDLTAVLQHPENECALPPTPRPRYHWTGTRELRQRQARAPEPCNRLLAARWSTLLGLDGHDLDWGEPASRPARALACHSRDRDPAGNLPRGGRSG